MSEIKAKLERKARRKKRVSVKITGTKTRPRVSVYRSNKYVFVQVVDDGAQKTITSATDRGGEKIKGTKTEKAIVVGQKLAESLKKLGIKSVVFDRGSYRYLGRLSALAQAMRDAGITI